MNKLGFLMLSLLFVVTGCDNKNSESFIEVSELPARSEERRVGKEC